MKTTNKIAIIGAGISGLAIARLMQVKGHEVTVFEKARGVGGRMSSRRSEDYTFDHGAQCFTIRTEDFHGFLEPFISDGTVKEWNGKVLSFEKDKKPEKRIWFEKHYVACPNMNSLCKRLSEELNVNLQTEVESLVQNKSGKWLLQTKESELGSFDHVISTAPPQQTLRLFPQDFAYRDVLSSVEMHPCFALMIGFKEKVKTNWIAARIRNSKIKWISLNSSKPERAENSSCFVVHASNSWSFNNVNLPVEEVQKQMIEEFEAHTGIKVNDADYISTHRWLYAIVKEANKPRFLIDENLGLSSCGDWCLTSRIEEAYLSSLSLCKALEIYFWNQSLKNNFSKLA